MAMYLTHAVLVHGQVIGDDYLCTGTMITATIGSKVDVIEKRRDRRLICYFDGAQSWFGWTWADYLSRRSTT